MPTHLNDNNTISLFFFNHVITKFCVLKCIVTDHGKHFQNHMMWELAAKLGFHHEYSMPKYSQVNGQVEAVN